MKKIVSVFMIMSLICCGFCFSVYADDDVPTGTETEINSNGDTSETPPTEEPTPTNPGDLDISNELENNPESIVDEPTPDDEEIVPNLDDEDVENEEEVKTAATTNKKQEKTLGEKSKAPKTGGNSIPYVVIITCVLGVVEVFTIRKRLAQR